MVHRRLMPRRHGGRDTGPPPWEPTCGQLLLAALVSFLLTLAALLPADAPTLLLEVLP